MNQFPEPHGDSLFLPVPDSYGMRLSLVFGNHAAGGTCPFYAASRCRHCDIGRGEGRQFTLHANRQRLAWYRQHFERELPWVNHVLLYNSGSMLNPREMPFELLTELLTFTREYPLIRIVSLESRETFVTSERAYRVCQHLRDDQSFRVIIGIESASDEIRNRVLRKCMPRKAIERAFDSARRVANVVGRRRIGAGVNVLVGGPGTTNTTAVEDAVDTVRFVLERTDLPVDFNVHPYYPSVRGNRHFPLQPRCSWPVLIRAVEAMAPLCNERGTGCRIFVGVNDEGHDTDNGDKIDKCRHRKACIEAFNRTQDISALAGRSQVGGVG